MATFWKYLVSLVIHMAWARAGKGPVPPVRLPRGKGPVNLPTIGPWQIMIAMWVARRLWEKYGHDVKSRVGDLNHPAAKRINDWIPSPQSSPSTAGSTHATGRSSSAPPATFTVNNSQPGPSAGTAPVGSSQTSGTAQVGIAQTAVPTPTPAAPNYQTKPLKTRRLPQGSILSGLRSGSAGKSHG
jgi:hypothetical protein